MSAQQPVDKLVTASELSGSSFDLESARAAVGEWSATGNYTGKPEVIGNIAVSENARKAVEDLENDYYEEIFFQRDQPRVTDELRNLTEAVKSAFINLIEQDIERSTGLQPAVPAFTNILAGLYQNDKPSVHLDCSPDEGLDDTEKPDLSAVDLVYYGVAPVGPSTRFIDTSTVTRSSFNGWDGSLLVTDTVVLTPEYPEGTVLRWNGNLDPHTPPVLAAGVVASRLFMIKMVSTINGRRQ